MDSPFFAIAIVLGLSLAAYETVYGATGFFGLFDTVGSIFRYGR